MNRCLKEHKHLATNNGRLCSFNSWAGIPCESDDPEQLNWAESLGEGVP